jgi:hypothetical protein
MPAAPVSPEPPDIPDVVPPPSQEEIDFSDHPWLKDEPYERFSLPLLY